MKWIRSDYHERLVMRCLLIYNQAGNLIGSIKHLVRNTVGVSDLQDKTIKGHNAYAMSELADMMVQCELIAAELGYKPEEVLKIGWQRYNERKEEFKKANKLHEWI